MSARNSLAYRLVPLVLLATVVAGGQRLERGILHGGVVRPTAADPRVDPTAHDRQARAAEVRVRFDQAVAMLNQKQYEYAATALHRVLALEPRMPEAHVNMGFAMLGMNQPKVAMDFFQGAIALQPMQANAYFGLAEALEANQDLPGAIGAMKTYLHLAQTGADDPFRRKAQAAVWEWEAALERQRVASKQPERK